MVDTASDVMKTAAKGGFKDYIYISNENQDNSSVQKMFIDSATSLLFWVCFCLVCFGHPEYEYGLL